MHCIRLWQIQFMVRWYFDLNVSGAVRCVGRPCLRKGVGGPSPLKHALGPVHVLSRCHHGPSEARGTLWCPQPLASSVVLSFLICLVVLMFLNPRSSPGLWQPWSSDMFVFDGLPVGSRVLLDSFLSTGSLHPCMHNSFVCFFIPVKIWRKNEFHYWFILWWLSSVRCGMSYIYVHICVKRHFDNGREDHDHQKGLEDHAF